MAKNNLIWAIIILLVMGSFFYLDYKKEGKPNIINYLNGTIIYSSHINTPLNIPDGWNFYTFSLSTPIQVTSDKLYYLYFNQSNSSYSSEDSSVPECQIAYSYIIDSTTYTECEAYTNSGHSLGHPTLGYLKSTFFPKSTGQLKSFTLRILKWDSNTGFINFIITNPQSCDNVCNLNQRKCNLAGYTICDDYNNDGCYEWGNTINCQGGANGCLNGYCKTCNTKFDLNCDNCVSTTELIVMINNWIGSQETTSNLILGINAWSISNC